jgi:hypothetical protein
VILYLSILLHFYNTIHIKFYIKKFYFTVPSVVQHFVNLILQFTTCFGLYRPSSGVSLFLVKIVTCVTICAKNYDEKFLKRNFSRTTNLGQLKKSNDLIETRTRDLAACSIVP